MYLRDLVVRNSGAIESCHIVPEFTEEGNPKPIVLVGSNGSGKTTVLSIVADALVELAATNFIDVAKPMGNGHKFYRSIGKTTTRIGKEFELSLLKFQGEDYSTDFISKSGHIEYSLITQYNVNYPQLNNNDSSNSKKLYNNNGIVYELFTNNAFMFFNSSRKENTHWQTESIYESQVDFDPSISNILKKPIILSSTIPDLKPFIIDVMIDSMIDIPSMMDPEYVEKLKYDLPNNLFVRPIFYINRIIQIITDNQNARIIRTKRNFFERKFAILDGNSYLFPSLESMSAGQSSLFGIFCTIIRYGDLGMINKNRQHIRGIVCIDEADAHLHPNLQFNVLPELIKLFPEVQFIISSHSPLFALGMQKLFGDDGFSLIEMPTGRSISAECYQDFQSAFEFFQSTKKFEESIENILAKDNRTLILCEGKLDKKYLEKAFNILGHGDFLSQIEIDFVGKDSDKGSIGGGKTNLNNAWSFLNNNPNLIKRKIILLYDWDAQKPDFNSENFYIRSMQKTLESEVRGIENLFELEIVKKFVSLEPVLDKDGFQIEKIDFDKNGLCEFICASEDPIIFNNFNPIIEMILKI